MYDVGHVGDAGDAVMARWLQSAGLQHLASPSASGSDQRLMPNPLVQGYGVQTVEEKQKLYKLMRNLNFNGDSGLEPYETQGFSGGVLDDFYSPELRGEFGAGLLDLHAMDDTELLSELVISEALETSPFMPVGGLDNDLDAMTSRQKLLQTDANSRPSTIEKEFSTKESNVAKIKVVVRKRPLNKKELSRKEEDIVTVHDTACLTVHEPKLKVDLTAYVEKHEFYFDDVLNETVSNDEVYRATVEPIIPTIFQRTKATCFAYGQTGSGKTFTMQPLPLRAAGDIVRLLHEPLYRNQRLKLWLSYFEIYGGKLFDLLGDRRKLCMREDGRQQVCIVGLQEFEVSDVQVVKEFIEKGNAARSTGSTGANEESSRSHAILQLVVKKQREVSESKRRNNDTKDTGKVVGKISFIDLAGSERGADTTDNDRQTRIEGAEINKSLLALKECIRALDNDQIHIPFRGSKLTEVLRDSFIGNSRTVMISCISPNAGSCEHTLNTLRYADRVKSLSKSGNSKKDQVPVTFPPGKESSPPSFPFQAEVGDPSEKAQDLKERGLDQKNAESTYYNQVLDRDSSRMITNFPPNGRDERVVASSLMEKEKNDGKRNYAAPSMHRVYSAHDSSEDQDADKPSMVSPPRRKVFQEEKYEKQTNWSRKEIKQQNPSSSNFNSTIPRHQEQGDACQDVDISVVLEEEDALIAAHRNEIEDTMEIVREEMKLLSEVEQPGSLIDDYVSQLGFLLSRKAAGLVSLQARLARFQHRLKEQEILSRKKGPR